MRSVIAGLVLSTVALLLVDRRFATVGPLVALTCAAVAWYVTTGED